jgi:hypothetical protein
MILSLAWFFYTGTINHHHRHSLKWGRDNRASVATNNNVVAAKNNINISIASRSNGACTGSSNDKSRVVKDIALNGSVRR